MKGAAYKVLKELCERHGIKFEVDADGLPTPRMLADFSAYHLAQAKLHTPKRGPGRPRGSVERRSPFELFMVEVARDAAGIYGKDFKKVLRKVVREAENKGLYPPPEHGGDPDAPVKRLERLKRAVDEAGKDALARALVEAQHRKKTGQ